MGHVCRVCENTLVDSSKFLDYRTVLADVQSLQHECGQIETDLRDSFNAFCFKCRRITMSVPSETTTADQVSYLRYQVDYFQKMRSAGLVVCDNADDS
jgi:hypothetical protein